MAIENFKVKKGLEVGTGITANSDGVDVTGIVTATQFKGDGSGLTGVTGSGSGVIVKDEGSAVGTAGTINFVGSGVAASLSAGTATVTINSGGLSDVVADTTPQLGGNLDLNSKIINGSGNIDYTGNLKASGISTATGGAFFGVIQAGVGALNATIQKTDNNPLFLQYDKPGDINLCNGGGRVAVLNQFNVAGISTLTGGAKLGRLIVGFSNYYLTIQPISTENTLHLNYDNGTTIKIGDGQTKSDLQINGDITPKASGNRDLGSLTRKWRYLYADSANITGIATFTSGVAKLFFSGTEKLTTTVSGITVPHINVSGIGTFGTRVDVNGLVFGTNATTFAAKFPDGAVSNFGTGNDLQISHANDVSLIRDARAGAGATLAIGADKLFLRNKDGNENYLEATDNGSVKLFYDFAPKFETDQAGVIITGVATATSFSGSGAGLTNIPSAQLSGALPALDGSALTGVTASGSGVIIKHDGSTVGTAGTINFSTNLDVSAISAGIVTVTASGGGGIAGISTTGTSVFNNIDVDGTTNLDNVDIVGITTIRNASGNKLYEGSANASKLFHNGSERLQTETYGIDINGTLGADQVNCSGIVTGTTFSGSGASLTNLPAANLSGTIAAISGANLTSLNASELDSGTIPNGRFPATLPAVSGANLTNLPVPTQITVTDQSGDTTCFPLFAQGATGNITPHTGTNLTFNSANGTLTATTFSGALSGNATSADTVDVTNDSSANTTFNPIFVDAAGSGKTLSLDTGLTYVPSSNVLTAGTFSGSGASLTNIPAGNLTGTVADARISTLTASKLTGALPAISGASLTNLPAPTPTNSDIQVVYAVTANGSSAYRFDGNGVVNTANNPDLYLIRGQKYRFINNSGGSHPFQIRVSNGGSAYSTGVTNNGAASGNIDFAPTYDSPAQLVYQCTSHGGMVGNIYIRGGSGGETNVGVTTMTGNGQTLTLEGNYGNEGHPAIKTSADLRFFVGNTESMRLKNSGAHVGIGTDDPLNRLHVRIQRSNGASPSQFNPSAALDSGNNIYIPAIRLHNTFSGGGSDTHEVGQLFISGLNTPAQWLLSCKKTGANVGDFIFRTRTGASTSAEKLRITSAGKVGIGTVNPSQELTVYGADPIISIQEASVSSQVDLGTGTSTGFINIQKADGTRTIQLNGSGDNYLNTGGKFGVGTNSPDSSYRTTIEEGTSGHGVLVLDRTSNIDGNFRSFVSLERSGTAVGTILCNNSSTQYNTTSDHRLKENVVTMSNATDRLKQLQPKRFNFILNPDITVDGFLAHEVQSVVPEAISGTKDEVDSDNNPVYQGIDQSKLVPLLTAALQESITEIETLKAKVAALEGS